MPSLLVRHATLLVAMDDADSRWADGGLYVEDNVIRQVGPTDALPGQADRVIDARDMVILPGCTTSSDHTYIWPNGARIDDQIQAARDMGLRFHAARGSMSVGESQGGLPPDSMVEDEDAILRDSRRAVEQYHDAGRYAMLRIVLAPCSPFSVSRDLMRQSVELARSYGVHAHTHLAETHQEHAYCLQTFGRTPVELAEELGWVGRDVWHAHVVHPAPDEITRLGQTGTGVAHCPSSNMRLASGIAPVRLLRQAGARVGLGVDGSASNDGSHLLT